MRSRLWSLYAPMSGLFAKAHHVHTGGTTASLAIYCIVYMLDMQTALPASSMGNTPGIRKT